MHYSTFIDCPLRLYFIGCLLINRILIYLNGCLGWDGCIIRREGNFGGWLNVCYGNGIMLGINGIIYKPISCCVWFIRYQWPSQLLCKKWKQIERETKWRRKTERQREANLKYLSQAAATELVPLHFSLLFPSRYLLFFPEGFLSKPVISSLVRGNVHICFGFPSAFFPWAVLSKYFCWFQKSSPSLFNIALLIYTALSSLSSPTIYSIWETRLRNFYLF